MYNTDPCTTASWDYTEMMNIELRVHRPIRRLDVNTGGIGVVTREAHPQNVVHFGRPIICRRRVQGCIMICQRVALENNAITTLSCMLYTSFR